MTISSAAIAKNIEVILNDLNIRYTKNDTLIQMQCPIHGGDNPSGCSICLERRIFSCWTHSCHDKYGHSLFGFLCGVLKNANAAEDLVKKYVNDEDLYVDYEEFYREEKAVSSELVTYPIDKVLAKLQIPSPYFVNRGFLPETLETFLVGELKVNEGPFRNRAVIPIREESQGLIIGFQARITNETQTHFRKYKNNKGFKKSHYLYNLDIAKDHHDGTIILVEGPADVWRMYEAGFKNTCAMFGSKFSRIQSQCLFSIPGIRSLICLTDHDEAGNKCCDSIQRHCGKIYNISRLTPPKKDVGEMSIEEIAELLA